MSVICPLPTHPFPECTSLCLNNPAQYHKRELTAAHMLWYYILRSTHDLWVQQEFMNQGSTDSNVQSNDFCFTFWYQTISKCFILTSQNLWQQLHRKSTSEVVNVWGGEKKQEFGCGTVSFTEGQWKLLLCTTKVLVCVCVSPCLNACSECGCS